MTLNEFTLNDVLDLVFAYDVTLDVYTSTESDPHLTLYEGPSEGCPEEFWMRRALGMWNYENGICVCVDGEE